MLPGIKLIDLPGRAAIITGGSKGLGSAMAEGLASALPRRGVGCGRAAKPACTQVRVQTGLSAFQHDRPYSREIAAGQRIADQ